MCAPPPLSSSVPWLFSPVSEGGTLIASAGESLMQINDGNFTRWQ
jgi:hypothetical protein